MDDLVSVVITTYKRNFFLKKAIDSVINQTYKDLEIIVIDDNGLENEFRIENRKLEREYKRKHSNIRFVYLEKNLGGCSARNEGIKNALGKYIAFLDDDDEFYKYKLEKYVERFNTNKEIDMVYSFVESNTGEKWKNVPGENPLYTHLLSGCLAATSQWMIKKDKLVMVNGFEETPAKQDSILIFNLLVSGCKLSCIEEVLSLYNIHDNTRISNNGKALDGEIIFFNKYKQIRENFSLREQRKIERSFKIRIMKNLVKQKRFISVIKYLL